MPNSCIEATFLVGHVTAQSIQTPGRRVPFAIEMLGDKWTLLVIRDIMIGNRRCFRDLFSLSDEGITRSMLTSRLQILLREGMVTETPAGKRRGLFSLTEKSIQLVPVLAQICIWGGEYLDGSDISARAEPIVKGGPQRWRTFMDELRQLHLKADRPNLRTV